MLQRCIIFQILGSPGCTSSCYIIMQWDQATGEIQWQNYAEGDEDSISNSWRRESWTSRYKLAYCSTPQCYGSSISRTFVQLPCLDKTAWCMIGHQARFRWSSLWSQPFSKWQKENMLTARERLHTMIFAPLTSYLHSSWRLTSCLSGSIQSQLR